MARAQRKNRLGYDEYDDEDEEDDLEDEKVAEVRDMSSHVRGHVRMFTMIVAIGKGEMEIDCQKSEECRTGT